MNFKIPFRITDFNKINIPLINQNFEYITRFFQQTPFTALGDGTNRAVFENDGTLKFEGNATVWDDLMTPGLAMRTNATAPDLITFAPATTNLIVYGFNGTGTTVEQTYFSLQFPHSMKVGSTVYPHVHWSPTTTGSGNVIWGFEYTWADIDGTYAAPTTIYSTAKAAGGTAWVHKLSLFDGISGAGITNVSSMMMCRLFRNPAAAGDTYEADAALLQFDVHYEKDTLGSRGEYSK
jgi:hypothetical protein